MHSSCQFSISSPKSYFCLGLDWESCVSTKSCSSVVLCWRFFFWCWWTMSVKVCWTLEISLCKLWTAACSSESRTPQLLSACLFFNRLELVEESVSELVPLLSFLRKNSSGSASASWITSAGLVALTILLWKPGADCSLSHTSELSLGCSGIKESPGRFHHRLYNCP